MFGLVYTALVALGFVGHQVKNAIKEQGQGNCNI